MSTPGGRAIALSAEGVTVGFLGLGRMGLPMAERLLQAGYCLTVWNRSRNRADRLTRLGARDAEYAHQVAVGADVVVSMLRDGAAVSEVLFDHGVADTLAPGAIFIDMSSIAPAEARRHAHLLNERGIRYLDAPVSGGTAGARNGDLAIMVGGGEDVFEAAHQVLSCLGCARRVGNVGAGQVAKLANQAVVAANILGVAEAILIARAGCVSPENVLGGMRGGFGESRVLAEHGERMLLRNFEPGGAASLHLKDLRNTLELAAERELSLPCTEVAVELLESLCSSGKEDYDHSAMLLALEERSHD